MYTSRFARRKVLEIAIGNTLMNGVIENWRRVSDEPSISNHRIIRLDFEGNFEVERILRNIPADQNFYQMSGEISSELELKKKLQQKKLFNQAK